MYFGTDTIMRSNMGLRSYAAFSCLVRDHRIMTLDSIQNLIFLHSVLKSLIAVKSLRYIIG